MTAIPYRTALIVGTGPGISASVARNLAAAGLKIGIAARDIDKLGLLASEIGPSASPSMPRRPRRSHICSRTPTGGSERPMS